MKNIFDTFFDDSFMGYILFIFNKKGISHERAP